MEIIKSVFQVVKDIILGLFSFVFEVFIRAGYSIFSYLLLLAIGILFLWLKDSIFSFVGAIIYRIKSKSTINTISYREPKKRSARKMIPRLSKRKVRSIIYEYTSELSHKVVDSIGLQDEPAYFCVWLSHFMLLPVSTWDDHIADSVLNRFYSCFAKYSHVHNDYDGRNRWVNVYSKGFMDSFTAFCRDNCDADQLNTSFKYRDLYASFIMTELFPDGWREAYKHTLNHSYSIYINSVSLILSYANPTKKYRF